jgi:hypothetical protein
VGRAFPDKVKRAQGAGVTTKSGQITRTLDKDYDLVWFLERCLSNALRLETYIQDAERESDQEVVDLFRKARPTARAPNWEEPAGSATK